MKTVNQHWKDHFIAKLIIYAISVILGVYSIEAQNPYIALTVGTQVWMFGVDAVTCIIEIVAGLCRLHDRI